MERTPSRSEITAQLERILSSAFFKTSGVQSKLLRYVVSEGLDGRDVTQKHILAELYGDAYVDPNSAKSTANHVRGKLEKYYAADGGNDPIRIKLPPGRGYKPWFGYNGSATSVRLVDAAMVRGRTPSIESLEESWNLFAEAYAIAPDNAALLARWSETALLLLIVEETLRATTRNTRPFLRQEAVRIALYALQLDSNAWLPRVVMGTVLLLSHDRLSASLLFDEALECDEPRTRSSLWYAFYLIATGKTSDGLEIVESRRWGAGADAGVHLAAAFLFYLAKDYARAWACNNDARAWGAQGDMANIVEGLIRLERDDLRGTAFGTFAQVSTEGFWPEPRGAGAAVYGQAETRLQLGPVHGLVVLSLVRGGFRKQAAAMMAGVLCRIFPRPKPFQMALGHMALGELDAALDCLKLGLQNGDLATCLLDSLPLLDPLRDSYLSMLEGWPDDFKHRPQAAYPEHAHLIEKANRISGEWWFSEEESPIFLWPPGHNDQ